MLYAEFASLTKVPNNVNLNGTDYRTQQPTNGKIKTLVDFLGQDNRRNENRVFYFNKYDNRCKILLFQK